MPIFDPLGMILSQIYQQSTTSLDSFAPRILAWFHQHGRHDLAWQQHHKTKADPYAVWLSEVMLQQTQVATVIPYFAKFMEKFPTVQDLAKADWEQVAELWAGLGYYARARNLHKGAKQLAEIIEKTGNFPKTVDDWQQISGVGQSTAGAVVAMGMRGFGVICDGNVKRVLTRWAGVDGDITKTATTKQLWQLAERLTSPTNSGLYAQAMMDMGATLCTKSKPKCETCPIHADCIAYANGNPTAYPVKSKKSPNPSKYSLAVQIIDNQGKLLWLQRPDNGIWGGLYSLPLFFLYKEKNNKIVETWQNDNIFENEYHIAEQVILQFLENQNLIRLTDIAIKNQPMIKHSLTHFHWFLSPLTIELSQTQSEKLSNLLQKAEQIFSWQSQNDIQKLALPTAMQKLLKIL